MSLPPFHYLAPRALNEALGILSEHKGKVRIAAGGTDIVDRLKKRLVSPTYLMSLRRVPGLTGIKTKKSEIVIAAGTTVREIAESPAIADYFKSVAEAAALVAAPPIQNSATIGGNLLQNSRCLFYNQSELVRKAAAPCVKQGGKACLAVKGGTRCLSVYQGDMAPSLIAFNATAVVQKTGAKRKVPVAELFSGDGKNPLSVDDDELLTEIILPIPGGSYGSSYQKLRMRSGLDYPLASSSVFISFSKKGVVDQARVVIGAAGPAPVLVEKASSSLMGKKPGEAEIEQAAEYAFQAAQAVNNLALPGAYRKNMVKVLTRRAIEGALSDLEKAGA
jgi:4-hydroxybenzoyl-CoA reductase subunit beta